VVEHRRLVARLMPLLGRVTQPALVLHAREDDVAHLDNAWRLQARLGGPVDVTVLDDCFHMISIDRQRHVVLDRVTQFVARIASQPSKRAARASEPATVPALAGAALVA
jgi:carboxylesterase